MGRRGQLKGREGDVTRGRGGAAGPGSTQVQRRGRELHHLVGGRRVARRIGQGEHALVAVEGPGTGARLWVRRVAARGPGVEHKGLVRVELVKVVAGAGRQLGVLVDGGGAAAGNRPRGFTPVVGRQQIDARGCGRGRGRLFFTGAQRGDHQQEGTFFHG